MSARIRPARAADIEPVCALLHAKMDPKIAPERWRRVMTYGWLADKPDLGRVVEADGRILGYIGAIYADRMIEGRRERIASITCWYLDKSLRGRGLGTALMAEVTADPAMSYTILTSSRNTLDILKAVGYRPLDDHRFAWRRGVAGAGSGARCVWDIEAIHAAVDDDARRMLDDHAGLPVRPLLAEAAGTRALLVFSVKRKGAHVLWFDLLHVSDRGFLGRHGAAIADAILPADEPAVLGADCRFVAGEAYGAVREPLAVPRYYKSTHLAPHQIDHLYSELQVLDLKLD